MYNETMNLELFHAITLASTLGLSYIINQSFLKVYELQITAIIFVVYFILKRTTRLTQHKYDLLVGEMFTFVVANIIISTGGITSPFFFLSYFLLFTLAMLLEPTISLFTSLCLVAMLYITQTSPWSMGQAISLISLPLMTPFAMLLGSEYEKNQELKKTTRQLTQIKHELEERINRHTENHDHFISLTISSQLKHIEELLAHATYPNIERAKEKIRAAEKLVESFGIEK